MTDWPTFSDAEILAARPARNDVSSTAAYFALTEPECAANGEVEDVATIFLTNRECPFRCLMCDLWKNTTTERVPVGSIPAQIEQALSQLPPAKHIKLYNSGNFFDSQAIPPEDHEAIANLVQDFDTVIVENHPRLCNDACLRFRDRINGELEIAIGLETIHPEVLPRLNKRMALADYEKAVTFLHQNHIPTRVFLLLRPPFLSEQEGVEWAIRSLEYAFNLGVRGGAVIPTRPGNGIMEQLQEQGHFTPPRLSSLEAVLQQGLELQQGRVFVDLWDLEQLYECERCGPARNDRLQRMNLSQNWEPKVNCEHCDS